MRNEEQRMDPESGCCTCASLRDYRAAFTALHDFGTDESRAGLLSKIDGVTALTPDEALQAADELPVLELRSQRLATEFGKLLDKGNVIRNNLGLDPEFQYSCACGALVYCPPEYR